MIMLVTATSDSHHCSCFGHLGWRDTDRIVSISCCITQGGLGKYCFMSLLLMVSLTNFANVNDTLLMMLKSSFMIVLCL
jgi:hypothetical protein